MVREEWLDGNCGAEEESNGDAASQMSVAFRGDRRRRRASPCSLDYYPHDLQRKLFRSDAKFTFHRDFPRFHLNQRVTGFQVGELEDIS